MREINVTHLSKTLAAIVCLAILCLSACTTEVEELGGNGGGNSSSGDGASNSSNADSGWIFEDFSGSGTPTGWAYTNFSRQSSGGIDNSACLLGDLRWNTTASITTAFASMGRNHVLSFKYKVTTGSSATSAAAASNALQYTVFISTDAGATWASLSGWTDVRNISSPNFETITVDLPAYANQRMLKVRVSFERITDTYVWIDDLALGTVPPIFSGAAALAAETVYNNYSSPLSINTRTYSIANKGSMPLTFSNISTTGGITVAGLPNATLAAFETKTFAVEINASSFSTHADYNGSFTFSTNAPDRPTVAVSVTGTVRAAPNGDSQDFAGTGTPAGWTYSNFSRQTSGCIDNSACLLGDLRWNTTTSVTSSLAAMGADPVVSFRYKATTGSSATSAAAASNALEYTLSVSADNGATWTNVLTDERHVSSTNFETITANLPESYANQIIRVRIIFTRITDCYVWLNDVVMGLGT
ncbi:MAG: hypothetical protein LBC85_10085 [Fibromonadaceae bacterium]|jgi:hypothetical protein|nr:hypothetical protein [Fibromonadaceae bacterium]